MAIPLASQSPFMIIYVRLQLNTSDTRGVNKTMLFQRCDVLNSVNFQCCDTYLFSPGKNNLVFSDDYLLELSTSSFSACALWTGMGISFFMPLDEIRKLGDF